jgi:Na+/melibiose symporter-like transporter
MEERVIQAKGATNATMFNYGFGAIGVGIKNNLLGVWLLLYYNQVLGLDAILVSAAMALALVVDAVSDPFVFGRNPICTFFLFDTSRP